MIATLRGAFHISAFGWYTFIVNYLAAKDGEELPAGIFVYGGPWKYLTFLNLLLQMTFFGLAAVNDFQPGKKAESALNRWKDLLFSVFAFPVGMFVVLLFWTIFAYDRELVYPATIDAFFPPWINHAMHTFVLPVLLGEVLVQPHTYPQMKRALAALFVVGLAYLSWKGQSRVKKRFSTSETALRLTQRLQLWFPAYNKETSHATVRLFVAFNLIQTFCPHLTSGNQQTGSKN
ncbi:androgen-dependent TFPI-regulating protein isoform 2-T2 [Anableps anableps]